jgi:hypothetical protein
MRKYFKEECFMKITEIVGDAMLLIAGVWGGNCAVHTIGDIVDTDTTAAAIRKTARAGVGITVYAIAMNYLLNKK